MPYLVHIKLEFCFFKEISFISEQIIFNKIYTDKLSITRCNNDNTKPVCETARRDIISDPMEYYPTEELIGNLKNKNNGNQGSFFQSLNGTVPRASSVDLFDGMRAFLSSSSLTRGPTERIGRRLVNNTERKNTTIETIASLTRRLGETLSQVTTPLWMA